MKTRLLMVAGLLLLGAAAVHAEDFKHKESGLQFTVPKGWTVTEKGGRLTVQNKDKSLALAGGVIEKAAAKSILGNIEKFLSKIDGFGEAKVTEGPTKEEANGLEQAWYEGTTKIKGDDGTVEELQWDMTIVTGGKAILFLVGTGKLEENEEAYEELFESIKKIDEDE